MAGEAGDVLAVVCVLGIMAGSGRLLLMLAESFSMIES